MNIEREKQKTVHQHMTCACCGKYTKGRQWHNRDTGYGLCPECADWLAGRGESEEEITRCYGVRGVHYDIRETE